MFDTIPHWTEIEFDPEDVCRRGYEKAAKYPTPQAAWDAWDDPNEMLWCLTKRHYFYCPVELIRCGLEIVRPVNAILERSLPKMQRFLTVQKKIVAWTKKPSEARLREIAEFLPGMKGALTGKRIPYRAAHAVYILAQSVFRRPAIVDLAFETGYAIFYAREYAPKPLIPGIENVDLTLARIAEHHCNIVRKHFPNAPSIGTDF